MTLRNVLLSAVLGAGLITTPAAAYITENGFTVRQIDNDRFEVLPRGGLGVSDAWCAAGDYVIRRLGQPLKTQIWRISEPPRPSGQSIVFSLSSKGAATTTGMLTSSGGASISASHGQQMCWAARELKRNR